MELQEWIERNRYVKNYAHFDDKISLSKVLKYIQNEKNISKHSFYPFIHYNKKLHKFKKGKKVPKERFAMQLMLMDIYIHIMGIK